MNSRELWLVNCIFRLYLPGANQWLELEQKGRRQRRGDDIGSIASDSGARARRLL